MYSNGARLGDRSSPCGKYMVMFNPEIVKKSGPYAAVVGCLSLTGARKAKRWQTIVQDGPGADGALVGGEQHHRRR